MGRSKLLCRSTNGAWGFDVIRETIRENRSLGDGAGEAAAPESPLGPATNLDEAEKPLLPLFVGGVGSFWHVSAARRGWSLTAGFYRAWL